MKLNEELNSAIVALDVGARPLLNQTLAMQDDIVSRAFGSAWTDLVSRIDPDGPNSKFVSPSFRRFVMP